VPEPPSRPCCRPSRAPQDPQARQTGDAGRTSKPLASGRGDGRRRSDERPEPRVDLSEYAAAVPQEVVDRLRAARRVLTICHENPEADALGSALAIALLVEANGGVATPVCADPMPAMYKFLPGMDRFRREPAADIDYDLLVVGDCGELERIGPVLESHRALFERVPILDIDHHVSNPHFGAFDWVDAGSSATCEMVTLLAWRMGVPLTANDGDARLGAGRGRGHGHGQLPAHQHDAAHPGRGRGPA
jgi:hypothetical protein